MAMHLLNSGREEQATRYVVLIQNQCKNSTAGFVGNGVTIDGIFEDDKTFLGVLEKLESRLGCELTRSAGLHSEELAGATPEPTPFNNGMDGTPLDSTFLTAKSNLMDVTGYTLDSPEKSSAQVEKAIIAPVMQSPGVIETVPETTTTTKAPMFISAMPPATPVAKSSEPSKKPPLQPTIGLNEKTEMPPSAAGAPPFMKATPPSQTPQPVKSNFPPMTPMPSQEPSTKSASETLELKPAIVATPQVTTKPKAAPSTAPPVMEGGGSASKKGRVQAPSSSGKSKYPICGVEGKPYSSS